MGWEEIDVPRGIYVGWGSAPGQFVEGAILVNNPTGATEPLKPGQVDATPCPLLEIELTKPAASFDRDLNRTDHPAGEHVCLSVSQKQLQRAVAAANLKPGDLARIELKGTERTANGTVKLFGIMVDRGAAQHMLHKNGGTAFGSQVGSADVVETKLTAPAGFGGANDEPPF